MLLVLPWNSNKTLGYMTQQSSLDKTILKDFIYEIKKVDTTGKNTTLLHSGCNFT